MYTFTFNTPKYAHNEILGGCGKLLKTTQAMLVIGGGGVT